MPDENRVLPPRCPPCALDGNLPAAEGVLYRGREFGTSLDAFRPDRYRRKCRAFGRAQYDCASDDTLECTTLNVQPTDDEVAGVRGMGEAFP
jgi:hypothetical protein